MTPLRIAVLASIFTSTTLCLAANPPPTLNVVTCRPHAGCIHHTIFGHDYKILSTHRFAVLVFLSTEGRYTRADVSITNLTAAPVNLSPKDFRIQALTSRSKVFLSVPPSQLENIPTLIPASANAPVPLKSLEIERPEIGEPEAARQRATQEAVELEAATPNLKAITIPPNQTIHGRVYFECDPATMRQQVNLVLPIAGTVFEFPYLIKP